MTTADLVQASCRLAGRRDVTSVHVIATQRPTYDELLRIRADADARGVDLTVDASGLSFRRRPAAPPRRASLAWIAITQHDLASGLDWLRTQGRTVRAELNAMREGTR